MKRSRTYVGTLSLVLSLTAPALADKALPDQAADRAGQVAFGQQGAAKGKKPDQPGKPAAGDKALPDQAADRAGQVAFGQEGRRQKALHAAQEEAKAEIARVEKAGVAAHGANSKAVGPGNDRGASAAARAGERGGPPANLDAVRNARAAGKGQPADVGRPADAGTQGRGR